MISICVTIKNRSLVDVGERQLRLFPNCVESVIQTIGEDIPCELVVADWYSTDWPLMEWLPQAAHPIPVRILSVDGTFSRGRGLNVAAAAARGQTLFFLDADALVCRKLFTDGQNYVAQGKAYFPVLFSYHDAGHDRGHWLDVGYGHCMLSKNLFLRSGGWPEYKKWGKEDDDFYARILQHAQIVRENVPGFYHQWHPDDLLWKNQFSDHYPALLEEQRFSEELRRDLTAAVPAGETVILVDEGRFDSDWLPDRKILPFLERDGVYWGPPADDTEALAQLARFQRQGMRYIAFGWMAFWWLDYYTALHDRLRQESRCVVEGQNVVLFDLQPHLSAKLLQQEPPR